MTPHDEVQAGAGEAMPARPFANSPHMAHLAAPYADAMEAVLSEARAEVERLRAELSKAAVSASEWEAEHDAVMEAKHIIHPQDLHTLQMRLKNTEAELSALRALLNRWMEWHACEDAITLDTYCYFKGDPAAPHPAKETA